MKSNAEVFELINQRKFDSVRYAAIERLKDNQLDVQSWTFLGQAMVGLERGRMAKLCFNRAVLLDPFAPWVQQAWTDAGNAGEGREDRQVVNLLRVPDRSVCACILTKNSSSTIGQCIRNIMGAVDEIVVVDTGSQDDTVGMVEEMGVEVHHFHWGDDFSAARNYALSVSKSEWILSIDSDEFLYFYDRPNIKTAVGLFSDDRFVLNIIQMNQIGGAVDPFPVPRLFRKEFFMWQFPIHEQPVLRDEYSHTIARSQSISIRLQHSGYDPDQTDVHSKYERNIRMLRDAIAKNPSEPGFYYYLGRALVLCGEYEEGIDVLERAYDKASHQSGSPILPEVSEILVEAYMRTNRLGDAIRSLEAVTIIHPEHPNAWYRLGTLVANTDPSAAARCFLKAKEVGLTYRGPSKFDASISAWKADAKLSELR